MPDSLSPQKDTRTFYAPDGRWWCARRLIPASRLPLLTDGRAYTPGELCRVYGLPRTEHARLPALPLADGERLPEILVYRIEADA